MPKPKPPGRNQTSRYLTSRDHRKRLKEIPFVCDSTLKVSRDHLAPVRSQLTRQRALAPVRSQLTRQRALAPVRSQLTRQRALAPVRSQLTRQRALAPVRSQLTRQRALAPVRSQLTRQRARERFKEILFARDNALQTSRDQRKRLKEIVLVRDGTPWGRQSCRRAGFQAGLSSKRSDLNPRASTRAQIVAVSEARPFGSGREPTNASAGEGSACALLTVPLLQPAPGIGRAR
jgi:hypothetical protein